jgi:hypothetical protein
MKRLSDNAIEIVNELHTERLNYESEYVPIIDALNRLAEYEDTRLEPEKIVFLKNVVDDAFSDKPEFTEHIRELLRTEKDGRLVMSPCKVGDTVWIKGDRFPAVIEEIRITDDGVYFAYVEYDKGYEETEVWDNDEFILSDFGKTVFLTREAAKKALEEV